MKKVKALLCLLLLTAVLQAQETDADGLYPAPSPLKHYVNFSKTFPQFLNEAETTLLEGKLAAFETETSNQLVIVVVDALGSRTAEQYARDLGNKWGVGQQKLNNGILILVKPTGGPGERDIRISIGTGLERRIPNTTVQQIVDAEIIPRFKTEDYYGALNNATDQLMAMAKEEFAYMNYHPVIVPDMEVPAQSAAAARADSTATFFTWMGIVFGLVIIIAVGLVRRNSWGSDTYCCHGHCHCGNNSWLDNSSWGRGSSWGSGGGSNWGGGSSSGGSSGGGSFGGGGGGGKW